MQNYREIAQELKQRIKTGKYSPDAPLPSRVEFMREFKVARATLDRAIRELVLSQLVYSRRGAGTYINKKSVHRVKILIIGNPSMENLLNCRLLYHVIMPSELNEKSSWVQLYDYDGLLWFCPSSSLMPIIQEMHHKIPQVILNRVLPNYDCVSTDHREAYRKITEERITKNPTGIPIFLKMEQESMPSNDRFSGFTDACRAAKKFYEIFYLKDSFSQKITQLKKSFALLPPHQPRLIFSDSLYHTGAVMQIAKTLNWQWGKTHFYNDFDNSYPDTVWGIKITSFIQDYNKLIQIGTQDLEKLIACGNTCTGIQRLLFPQKINGDT